MDQSGARQREDLPVGKCAQESGSPLHLKFSPESGVLHCLILFPKCFNSMQIYANSANRPRCLQFLFFLSPDRSPNHGTRLVFLEKCKNENKSSVWSSLTNYSCAHRSEGKKAEKRSNADFPAHFPLETLPLNDMAPVELMTPPLCKTHTLTFPFEINIVGPGMYRIIKKGLHSSETA